MKAVSMSFYRKKYNSLFKEKVKLVHQKMKLEDKIGDINIEMDKVLPKIFKDEKIFDGTHWSIYFGSYETSMTLIYVPAHDKGALKEKLLFLFVDNKLPEYYDTFIIDDSESFIEIGSTYIKLCFDNAKIAMKFVNEYNIFIDQASLKDQIKKTRLPLVELEKLAHSVEKRLK